MKKSYSIPTILAEQYSFQRTVTELLAQKATEWGVAPEQATLIQGLSTTYESKYEAASNSQTQSPALTSSRRAAWKPLIAAISDLYNNNLLYNGAITAEDQDALHIHEIILGARTPYDAPVSSPSISMSTEDVSTLHVNYTTTASSKSHRKPAGVAFCELACKIGGDAPAGIEECTAHYNISHSNQEIVFTPEQRGKTVFTYARWVNKNGKNGPWSNPITSIIP
ncbi:hypothetical protein [Mangrovibacterium lignilyticum]|uniref:hypothetical protein n=1 Tax=Mangrovibacterium lignilyticum TaxID=2668052 RepID=UPI0013D0E669|nr:hypothetical protein [Mangrovibacterium lignilyticum]